MVQLQESLVLQERDQFELNGFAYEVLAVNKNAVWVEATHANGNSKFYEVWQHVLSKKVERLPNGAELSMGRTVKPSSSKFAETARCYSKKDRARQAFEKLSSGIRLSKI